MTSTCSVIGCKNKSITGGILVFEDCYVPMCVRHAAGLRQEWLREPVDG